MIHESFRTHRFNIDERPPHFAYSLTMCDEERDFRETHWDIAKGDVVIDAGASYGAYTLSALAAGAGAVFAFEPEPTVAAGLAANIALNDWETRGMVVVAGLWDEADSAVRFDSYAPHWPKGTADVPFKMVRLDDYWAKVGRLDWLKLDVEGAEVRALRGGLETIKRCGPRMIIEVHKFMDATLGKQVREMLDWYEWEEFDRDPCSMLVGRPK